MLPKPIRVCVLACSYEGSDSELRAYEGELVQTPQHYFTDEDEKDIVFTLAFIKKATTYRQIRQLVKSGNYDVFYNQCDGAIDEDKAGIDVVQALESFNVPFTGAVSTFYELSKPQMKHIAHHFQIKTAKHAVVEADDDIRDMCAALSFPLIIKHVSGYSSVGMDKSCKVYDMPSLQTRVARFIEQYQIALVEEFVSGDEATVLVCADSTLPTGVRVFPPVMVQFPEGEDFKHFHLKWETYEGMEWRLMAEDDPAYLQVISTARTSFLRMMGGVGYGRVDVRIDRSTNDVIFLEINPNCGVMYPYGQEGSADWILRLTPNFKQREFALLQIEEARKRNKRLQPLFRCVYTPTKGYQVCATRDISVGAVIFDANGQPVRLYNKSHMKVTRESSGNGRLVINALPLGLDSHHCAMWGTELTNSCIFRHSCAPNTKFRDENPLILYSTRDISQGEELTIDYSSFFHGSTQRIKCHCGDSSCKGWIAVDNDE